MQRYRCSQCSKTFSDSKEVGLLGHKQAIDEDRAMLVLKLLVEGNSIRSTQRITGIDKTIFRLLVDAGQRCEVLLSNVVRNVPVKEVQADEIWSYVGKKEAHKGHGDGREVGDAWVFIGIERHSKLVLAFELGKRTVSSASRFITKLADATHPDYRFLLSTDGLNAYPFPVGNILGDRVDYGQVVKSMRTANRKPHAAIVLRPMSNATRLPSTATPTNNASALHTSSVRMVRSASGASGSRV